MNFRKVLPLHVLCLSCVVTQLSALDRCVHNGNDKFSCTHDPLLVRERLDARSLDVGEHQRIEGSEEEKRNIREVLRQMDAYFNDEVLAMPEYEHVRFRCKNSNGLCAFWASVGECEGNRVFMMKQCAAVCRFCLLAYSGLE